jgi:hypothetical protein
MVPVRTLMSAAVVVWALMPVCIDAAGPAKLPAAPRALNPPNGTVDVSASPTLSWSAPRATSFDVYFGKAAPLVRVATRQASTSYTPSALSNGTTYYWQIVAFNNDGSTSGSQWSFTTVAAAPAPPATPSAPSPASGATGVSQSVTLTWTASGATSYTVRAGASNPPPVVASGLTTASYAPANLAAGTTYYWQVVAANSGGSTTGPVWSFATTAATGARTWNVAAGGDLQGTLNSAQPGDTILLQAGATFSGNFVLPAKAPDATSYLTIRSSADPLTLPAPGVRIDPTYAALLPKLRSPNMSPALATAPYAHHYRIELVEFLPTSQGANDIVVLGDGSSAQNVLSMVPHDLVVDRVYIHGDVILGQKRGIALNSASTTIQNSYISEIKSSSQDSQAICGWNGPGPYTITNNYLEAAGENVLFGGSDPAILNLVPSDITFRRNYLTKPLTWKTQGWVVKNVFELKNAQRVTIDGNIIENNWLAAQAGYAVVLTPRNQGGAAPWSVVQHVTFTNNVVRHVASAINMLGTDNEKPSQTMNDVVIRNNLFVDVGGTYGGDGRMLLINGGVQITVDHNTAMNSGMASVYAYGTPVQGFTFTNNTIPDNSYGIIGDGTAPGQSTVTTYFPNAVLLDNVIVGAPSYSYPTGNYFPATMSAVGFVSYATGNYRLAVSSPYYAAATDGTAVGANIDAINVAAGTIY